MRFSVYQVSRRGGREKNEDRMGYCYTRDSGLFALADGMGGRSGGRKASDQVMLTAKQLFDRFDPETDDPRALLKQIVNESHMVIKLTAVSAEQEPHSTIAAFMLLPNGERRVRRVLHAADCALSTVPRPP